MVYAKFGGQTECIMGNWKIENTFDFSQGHVTKNQPMAVPVQLSESLGI